MVRLMSPKLSPGALQSCWKIGNWFGSMQLPKALIVDSGVYSPLSSAAVAVTVLNVEPGG